MIPTNSGVFADSTQSVKSDYGLAPSVRKGTFYIDQVRGSKFPPWECVYFVRGGYVGAKCANQGSPIKFQIYFIDGDVLRRNYKQSDDDVYGLCLIDVYPVFQISHENCASLSNDITEACVDKILEKEQAHYQLHKDSLEPFSRIHQGLDVFCFLLDTLPLSISENPEIEDPSQTVVTNFIDLSLDTDEEEGDDEGFELIKRLLEHQDQGQA